MKASVIRDSMESRVATLLPSFVKLLYVHDVEKNEFLEGRKCYGVRILDSEELDVVAKRIEVETTYEIVLTADYVSKENDDDLTDQIDILHDNVQTIYSDLMYSCFDTNVMMVSNLLIEEPEILDAHDLVTLRFSLVVRYKIQI